MVRKDFKYLLVDAGRRKYDGSKKRVRDDDMQATHAPMRNHSEYWSPGDYLSPLYRCIRKQVGRPWDKVFSELCASADSKSLQGLHLRQHIWDIVVPNHEVVKTKGGYRRRPRWSHLDKELMKFSDRDLFIDDYGILQKPKKKELSQPYSYREWQERKANYFVPLSKNEFGTQSAHIFFSGHWWYVEWLNFNPAHNENDRRNTPWLYCKKFLVRSYREEQFALTTKEDYSGSLSYIYRCDHLGPRTTPTLIFPTLKRQLSSRDIKNLGLAA